MVLATLGAVLNFALQLEERTSSWYATLLEHSNDENVQEISERLRKLSNGRIIVLKRLRSENVTEMILEPIYGLDSANYTIPENQIDDISNPLFKVTAEGIELCLKSFYKAAAKKIDFLSEVAYAFEDLADEVSENIESIQLLQ